MYQGIYQDKRWKKLRLEKMRVNPLCERCANMDRITPAEEVHHKIPFDIGMTQEQRERLAFDWDNLMSVCNECHDFLHLELKRT